MFRLSKLLLLLLVAVPIFACSSVTVPLLAVYNVSSTSSHGAVVEDQITPIKEAALIIDISSTLYARDLQQSIRTAYKLAKLGTRKSCGFSIKFYPSLEEVSGPSGGLALALAFHSALTDENLPLSQYGITGAIREDGSVLPVGGVLEKAEAAMSSGKKALIAPLPSRYEYILAKHLYENFTIYYVSSFDEALDILKGKAYHEHIDAVFNASYELPDRHSPYNYSLNASYHALRSLYLKNLHAVSPLLPKRAKLFYERLLNFTDRAIELGYDYTASNSLFLAAAELMALNETLKKGFHLNPRKSDVFTKAKACISELMENYTSLDINSENFEYVAAARFRIGRALATLSKPYREATLAYRAAVLFEYAQAYEWCLFSSELLAKASAIKGKPINQPLLKSWVNTELDAIDENELSGEERTFYLLALKAAAKGQYATSAYYIAYLYAYQNKHLANYSQYRSFWGKVFASHALFYNQSDPSIGALADNLEHVARLVASLPSPDELSSAPESEYSAINSHLPAFQMNNTSSPLTPSIYKESQYIISLLGGLFLGLMVWIVKVSLQK